MKKIYFTLQAATAYLFIFTGSVSAQVMSGPSSGLLSGSSTLKDVIDNILKLFNSLVPLLIGAAVVCFLYGVLVFIAKSSSGNADGRKEGINFMIFGIIGIAVMVSLWGLVAFVTNTLGTEGGGVPQFKTQGGFNQPGGAFGPVRN